MEMEFLSAETAMRSLKTPLKITFTMELILVEVTALNIIYLHVISYAQINNMMSATSMKTMGETILEMKTPAIHHMTIVMREQLETRILPILAHMKIQTRRIQQLSQVQVELLTITM